MPRSTLLLIGAGVVLVIGATVLGIGVYKALRGPRPPGTAHLDAEEAAAWKKLKRSFTEGKETPVYIVVRCVRTKDGPTWGHSFDPRANILTVDRILYGSVNDHTHRGEEGLGKAIEVAKGWAERPECVCVTVVDLFSGEEPSPVWWGRDAGDGVKGGRKPPTSDLADSLHRHLETLQKKVSVR